MTQERDELRAHASMLGRAALTVIDELFPDDASGDGDYQAFPSDEDLKARKEEFLDRLLALEDVPPTDRDFAWTVALSSIGWHRKRYRRFAVEVRAAGRRRAVLLDQFQPIYVEASQKTVIPLEMAAELNRLLVSWDRLPQPTRPFPPELSAMVEELRIVRDGMLPAVQAHEEELRQARRDVRLAAHRKPDVVMTGTICSKCGKKPARVDDLCKKCAREAGTLPHGKII